MRLPLSSPPLPPDSMLSSQRGGARFWPFVPPNRRTTAHTPILKWEREGACPSHRKRCKILAINSTEYLGKPRGNNANTHTCMRTCKHAYIHTCRHRWHEAEAAGCLHRDSKVNLPMAFTCRRAVPPQEHLTTLQWPELLGLGSQRSRKTDWQMRP